MDTCYRSLHPDGGVDSQRHRARNCACKLLVPHDVQPARNVWLNGHQIANSQQMFGTFRQFEFDVTKQISQKNELTVEVLRAQPGEPNTGFVDWNPRPADESMGIFREVSLKTCGPVSLTHSAVRSRVNSKTLDEAWLTIATELTNYSDNVVSGKVKGTADGHPFECPVTLAAGEKRALTLAEEIHVEQPRLWWCHQMGQPERCDLHIEFVEDGKMSDSEDVVSASVRSAAI